MRKTETFPHVVPEGEWDCSYCGASGDLEGEECSARLRIELDAALAELEVYREGVEAIRDDRELYAKSPARSIILQAEVAATLVRTDPRRSP